MPIHAARLQVTVGADTSDAEGKLDSFSSKMGRATAGMAKTGGVLSAAFTAPLVGMGVAAVNSAADFEQTMNILQSVTGATEDVMADLNEQALQLGADTVFSAGEAAEAMLELGKAGFDSQKIMDAMPGVMDLAAAADIELAEAAGITTAALNTFGLAASESARIADLMAAAANASSADISDLGAGMRQAGFAFNLANQPVENLAASLAILTNVGLTGSDAGTALKNAFMRMMNPTKEANELMQELGISFYDANGNMRQLPQIIDILNQATAGLTAQQRDAALATIFLSDGMKAIVPLMDVGAQGFNDMVAEVDQVGSASETANARMGGLRGGIEQLRGSVDSFLIGAASPFLDTLGGIAREAGNVIDWFGTLEQPVINAGLAFLGVLAAAGPLALALAGVAAAMGTIGLTTGIAIVAAGLLAAAWASNAGDIQTHAANVATAITDAFTKISTAWTEASFPTAAELWADFSAGEFPAFTTKIRDAVIQFGVNLQSEFDISFDPQGAVSTMKSKLATFKNTVITNLTNQINGIDFEAGGGMFAGLVDKITSAVNGLELSGINWVSVFTRILLGPMGAAINGLTWVLSGTNFGNLKTAVMDAIAEIPWGNIATSLAGLGTAIGTQLGKIGADILADFNIKPSAPQFKLPEMKDIVLPPPKVTVSPNPPPITIPPPEVNVPDPNDARWQAFLDWPQQVVDQSLQAMQRIDSHKAGERAGQLFGDRLRITLEAMNNAGNAIEAAFKSLGERLSKFDYGEFSKSLHAWSNGFNEMIMGWVDGFVQGLTGITIDRFNPKITKGPDPILSQQKNLMAEPPWWSQMQLWSPPAPQWIANLLAWQPATPDWITNLLTWELKEPAWMARLGEMLGQLFGFGGTGGGGGAKGGVQAQSGRGGMGGFQFASFNPYATQSDYDTTAPEPLVWADYVEPLLWTAFAKPLQWEQFVRPFQWEQFLQGLQWGEYVQPLPWQQFISMLSWSVYVNTLNWASYVVDLNWANYVGDLSWGDYIPSVDWSRYIPRAPISEGGAVVASAGAAGFASAAFAGETAGAGGVNITVNATVASDIDIHQLAEKLAREIRRRSPL